MKYVVLVPDGCADEPLDVLGGRTPLEAASMPSTAALAARGEVGRAAVIPEGLPPGSDVGNMAILGYDPARFHTGRSPIEAAAMGVDLAAGEVAFRANLVTIDEADPETMVDFAAGHITTAQAEPIIEALDAALAGSGVRFHAGVEYRHLCVLDAALGDAECTPPHDLTDRPLVWPTGPAADSLRDLMLRTRPIVAEAAARVGASATQIWLWGQGTKPQLPDFTATHGVSAAMSSAVDLVRGLGVLGGIEVVDVPTATAGFDNDYVAQRDACLASLLDRDLFLLHVEATDEAGHQGLVDEKIAALERWDRDIIGPMVDELERRGEPFRILMLPDHATPCTTKTHSRDPVPYLIYDSTRDGPGGEYTEPGVAPSDPVVAHELMPRLLAGLPPRP